MSKNDLNKTEKMLLNISGFVAMLIIIAILIYILTQIIFVNKTAIVLDVKNHQSCLTKINVQIDGKNDFCYKDEFIPSASLDTYKITELKAGKYHLNIVGIDTIGYPIYGVDTILQVKKNEDEPILLSLGRNKAVASYFYFDEESELDEWGGNVSPSLINGRLRLEAQSKTSYVYNIFDTSATANLSQGCFEFDALWENGEGYLNIAGQPKRNNMLAWGPSIYFYHENIQVMQIYPAFEKVGKTYQNNKWYHILIKFDINQGMRGQYSITVDDELIIENVNFISPEGHLRNIVQYAFGVYVYDVDNPSVLLVDNILLKETSPN